MDPRGCTKLRSSLEAVLGRKSYLHDVTELPGEKNRAKKAVCGQEYTYKAVMGSLRRDCAELDLTPDGLVRVLHAPPLICFDLYVGGMI